MLCYLLWDGLARGLNGYMHSLCISIVSHNQGDLVAECLASLSASCGTEKDIYLIITLNVAGESCPDLSNLPWPVKLCVNEKPSGFGANHNRAYFKHGGCQADYFCVLNPDIIFYENPFPALCSLLQDDKTVGVVSPLLFDSEGVVQDNGRDFPTLGRITARLGERFFPARKENNKFLCSGTLPLSPDWLAGMFMLFPAAVYGELNGFDEDYFMYCEDTDLCWRLAESSLKTALINCGRIVHNPRRASWKNCRHMLWHCSSMLRFLLLTANKR